MNTSCVTRSPRYLVDGYISEPLAGKGRSSTDRQYFYVNGRPCEFTKVSASTAWNSSYCLQFTRILNEAYRSFNTSQYPFVILSVTAADETFDVNVTPDKRTIILHDESTIVEEMKVNISLSSVIRSVVDGSTNLIRTLSRLI